MDPQNIITMRFYCELEMALYGHFARTPYTVVLTKLAPFQLG